MADRITSHDIKDCNHLTIVSVIAAFDTDRNIKPLYVRIGEESLKVNKSTVIEALYHQTTFQCEVIDGEYVRYIKLKYFANQSLWAIPRV